MERVDHLVLAAIERDHNTAAEYAIERAIRLVTLKLVGYTEVVHTLVPKMHPGSSIVVFGGQAMQRPYPGSTTVSTVNGGVVGLVHTLACELAPIRVNGIHPASWATARTGRASRWTRSWRVRRSAGWRS